MIIERAREEILPLIKFNWTLENLGHSETPKFMWIEDTVKWEFWDKIEYIDDGKYLGEWDPILKKPHGFGFKLTNDNKNVSLTNPRSMLDILNVESKQVLAKTLGLTHQTLATVITECLMMERNLGMESVCGLMAIHMKAHGMEAVLTV